MSTTPTGYQISSISLHHWGVGSRRGWIPDEGRATEQKGYWRLPWRKVGVASLMWGGGSHEMSHEVSHGRSHGDWVTRKSHLFCNLIKSQMLKTVDVAISVMFHFTARNSTSRYSGSLLHCTPSKARSLSMHWGKPLCHICSMHESGMPALWIHSGGQGVSTWKSFQCTLRASVVIPSLISEWFSSCYSLHA